MNTQKTYQKKPVLTDAAFPPLGSAPVKPKPVLDFKKTVATPAPTQPTQPSKQYKQSKQPNAVVTSPPKKHVSYTRYGDDFPDDYDGPPEEDFDDEEEEEEEECEDVVSTRRRGDRGIW
jgi:hypothetical protein